MPEVVSPLTGYIQADYEFWRCHDCVGGVDAYPYGANDEGDDRMGYFQHLYADH
jgi:hypothetical protein